MEEYPERSTSFDRRLISLCDATEHLRAITWHFLQQLNLECHILEHMTITNSYIFENGSKSYFHFCQRGKKCGFVRYGKMLPSGIIKQHCSQIYRLVWKARAQGKWRLF